MMEGIEPEPKDERRQFVRLMQEMRGVRDTLLDMLEQQKVTNVLMTRLLNKTKEMEENIDGINTTIDSINAKMSSSH